MVLRYYCDDEILGQNMHMQNFLQFDDDDEHIDHDDDDDDDLLNVQGIKW